jgi:hypothetical protein
MPPRLKKTPRTPRVRTGGAVGDTSMDDMTSYNEAGAGVDESKVVDCDGDPNADLPQRRLKGSES